MKKWIAVTCFCGVLLAQAGAAVAALPDSEYVCKVLTRTQQIGLVMVQADDLTNARRIAAVALALRLDGINEQAKTVVECVDYPQQRLSDAKLQAFLDSMPR